MIPLSGRGEVFIQLQLFSDFLGLRGGGGAHGSTTQGEEGISNTWKLYSKTGRGQPHYGDNGFISRGEGKGYCTY